MTTSGTVGATPYSQTKIIDHGLRRAGRIPENVGGEDLDFASDNLFTILSEYVNAGYPLWTRQYLLLAGQIGSPEVALPAGNIDVFTSFWRILQPYRAGATLTSGGDATALFAGAPTSDVVIPGPNPGVIVNFGSATEVDTIGVLPGLTGMSVTASIQINGSTDGVAFVPFQTLPSTTFTPGQWSYFDLDPTMNGYIAIEIILSITGSWTVQQFNIGLANGQDIPLGVQNIDDYYNLPDKMFQSGRPTTVYVDRQIAAPVLKIWPTYNSAAFYNGTVVALSRRYIQDPGQLTNNLEIPPRAIEMIQWKLASILIYELPDKASDLSNPYITLAKKNRMDAISQNLTKSEALFWAEERTNAPIRFAPNLSPYTA